MEKNGKNLIIAAAVANQSGTMEVETISKNGRSLKSHTIRAHHTNTSKKFFTVIVLLGAFSFAAFCQHSNENDFAVLRKNIINVFIMEYKGVEQIVNIPSRIQDKKVIFIGANAFKNKNITSVTIPNSVTSIRSNAFFNNNLTAITIPNSVTAISPTAFLQNPITCITIGANVKIQPYTDYNGIIHTIAFDNGFDDFYVVQGRMAGTYTYSDGRWNTSVQ